MIGKKVESNKALPARGALSPPAQRPLAMSAARSEPPMDVDPTELIPSIPPTAQTSVNIDDVDLEDDSATLMFKRPGPPRRPPPPMAKPAGPPGKALAKPPLPAPTGSNKPFLAAPKAPEKNLAGPPKTAVKPLVPKPSEKPSFDARPANEPFFLPKDSRPSEWPMFEVTLGSEKPLLATPEASEIALRAPKAPNMPLLAAPLPSDLASFDFKFPKPGPPGAASPMLALPMLDFSRDVSGQSRSSHPNGLGTRMVGFARKHAKWLVITSATAGISGASWMVFRLAAAGSETAAEASARGATAAPTSRALAAQATLPAATHPTTVQPEATANPEPVAPQADEPAPIEKGQGEVPTAAERAGSSTEVAAQPGAAPPAEAAATESPAAERPERPAPVVTGEPVARALTTRTSGAAERGSSRPSDPASDLPTAKPAPAPEPVPAPAPAAPPSVSGMDGTPDFDQGAAMAALRQAAESARRCQTPDAPSGGVRIAVTFARSGGISATQVEGPAAGTPLGDCVVAKFQNVRVPAFRGSVMTVRKTVMF